MTDRTSALDRRTGRAAVAAGVLMFLSVATELIWTVQRPDGSVFNMPMFLLFIIGFAAGSAALGMALHGLGRGVPLSRPGRIGHALSLAGAGLLVAFSVVFGVTGVVTGTPLETAFWSFLIGFLLLILGSVPLGLGLRRSGIVGPMWAAVPVAGAGAVVAILTPAPWHDLGLLTYFGSWAVLGLRLLRANAPVGREAVPSA